MTDRDKVIDLEKESEKEDILNRLRRVEGQIRGIQNMIAQDRECGETVTQVMAARAALDGVGLMIMTHHIEQCLLDSEKQTNRAELEKMIAFFLKFTRAFHPVPTDEATPPHESS